MKHLKFVIGSWILFKCIKNHVDEPTKGKNSETKTNSESVGLREMKYSNFKHKHEDGATRRRCCYSISLEKTVAKNPPEPTFVIINLHWETFHSRFLIKFA